MFKNGSPRPQLKERDARQASQNFNWTSAVSNMASHKNSMYKHCAFKYLCHCCHLRTW